jgi:adenosylcobalamin-dependent ribonucleoside-triphosphate reductase
MSNMTEYVVADGMPRSLFENKYSRRKPDGTFLTWSEHVATNVVPGNLSLPGRSDPTKAQRLKDLAVQGVIPFSGRHLQHGDLNQPSKTGERFTNCSTSMTSFQKFWLLMQGSGVGRLYDADICRVDWSFMPHARFVLSKAHPDYADWIESTDNARHRYDSESETTRWFTVEDSAEGWTKVVEILETAAFQRKHKDKLFIFDFSEVREKGRPIKGQQGRPASGPVPFIRSLMQVVSIRDAGMPPWRQAMHIDHHLSECILLGGIRRSARIACKSWREHDVMAFIDIKRGGYLWSANNSVVVDDEFWEQAASPAPSHARRVFDAMVSAAYFDGTGEPGFLNASKMDWVPLPKPEHYDVTAGHWQSRYHPRTKDMLRKLYEVASAKKQQFIVNPCGEIVLSAAGGYCVISDICMAYAEQDEDLVEAAALTAEALIRVNTMPFMYEAEVDRTNRIGIGLTGIFEYAWRRFGYTFFDLLDEAKSQPFWDVLKRMRASAVSAAQVAAPYQMPHTMFTIKPSGTISKVMSVTEGAHLPAMPYYMRWVQFRKDDPTYLELREKGYPWKDVSSQYPDTHVIGYPTSMALAREMGDRLVTMHDVTLEQQYQWLRLLEEHWIGADGRGNQISYTMKYDPRTTSFEEYKAMILTHQPNVRACSMAPLVDLSAYSYVPEEPITREEYEAAMAKIEEIATHEKYDDNLLRCEGGACPIEFDVN